MKNFCVMLFLSFSSIGMADVYVSHYETRSNEEDRTLPVDLYFLLEVSKSKLINVHLDKKTPLGFTRFKQQIVVNGAKIVCVAELETKDQKGTQSCRFETYYELTQEGVPSIKVVGKNGIEAVTGEKLESRTAVDGPINPAFFVPLERPGELREF